MVSRQSVCTVGSLRLRDPCVGTAHRGLQAWPDEWGSTVVILEPVVHGVPQGRSPLVWEPCAHGGSDVCS